MKQIKSKNPKAQRVLDWCSGAREVCVIVGLIALVVVLAWVNYKLK